MGCSNVIFNMCISKKQLILLLQLINENILGSMDGFGKSMMIVTVAKDTFNIKYII
jgi:hypothetical protein